MPMWVDRYRPVWAVPAVRRAVALGFLVRMPMFTIGILVTIHVVTALGRSYTAAGVAAMVSTAAIGLGAPWRGRLLDRYGLRAVVGPAILVQLLVGAAIPFLPYAPLLAALAVSGLFVIPGHALIRQTLITAVPADRRRTALSLDGIVLELSAAIGPAVAVGVATSWSTRWMLLGALMANVAAGVLLWLLDLPIHQDAVPEAPVSRRTWLGARFLAILAACATVTVVLSATEISAVAVLREADRPTLIGVVLAAWCIGSLVGGLAYGAMRRQPTLPALLLFLGLTTAPAAVAHGPVALSVAMFVAGLGCQPAITAGVEALTRVVPDRARGEALGWHGSAMTGGSAMGAPLAGLVIDARGGSAAFLGAAVLAVVIAVTGIVVLRAHR